MSRLPPAGWYPDPDGSARVRWWDGTRWTACIAPAPQGERRGPAGSWALLNPLTVAVGLAVLFFAFMAAVSGGVGAFLVVVALAIVTVAIVALRRGRLQAFGLSGRRQAKWALIGGAGLLVLGSVVAPTANSTTTSAVGPLLPVAGSPSAHPATADEPDEPVAAPTGPAVTERLVTEEEAIPFSQVTVNDPNADAGTSVVAVPGVAGVLHVTYRVTLVDGVETERVRTGERVLRAAVDQVTRVGTRVQPAPASGGSGCDPNYAGGCVPIASDVDCAGGGGNGPAYFSGTATVVGSDIYDLDRDGDGIACEG